MYCKKCGEKVKENYKFCKNCGTPISNNLNSNNNIIENINIKEEDLVKIYVGNNYNELKRTKFSIPTFFLGIYYFLYRKMWLYALISFIIVVISFTITIIYENPIYILIQLIYIIFMAFKFNDLYIKKAEKRVNKIKQINNNKTNKELALICKTKGGVSILAVILTIVILMIISFISIFIIVFCFIFNEIPDKIDKHNNYINDNSKLEYVVPDIFKDNNYHSKDYANYSYYNNNASCNILISNSIMYEDTNIDNYIKNDVTIKMDDTVSDIKTSNINNYEWKYVEIKSENSIEYYYASIFDNRVYKVKYKINKDNNNLCTNGYNTFINSLKFKKEDIKNDNII